MATQQISTPIGADINLVFDLARCAEFHTISAQKTKEEIISGRKEGLLELNESVTFRAKHFGLSFDLTAKITAMDAPHYFIDEMEKGPFKYLKHTHRFESSSAMTIMTDIFEYSSPFGIIGKWVDALFMTKYLTKFIKDRNAYIKLYAETDKWKKIRSLDKNTE
ncbi:MAG: SRPBCC family protein [Saprospiraceae bacterium]|nr:SRPBCC family protein [Saprospiraceae bacterium]